MTSRTTAEAGASIDVAVVGAGVAALAAALAVERQGASVRVLGGPRGLSHLASGAWDRGHFDDLVEPIRSSVERVVREAERAVLQALGGYRAVPFRAEDRPLVATACGTLRRVLSAERNVLDLRELTNGRIAVVGLAATPTQDPRALARALDEDAMRRGLACRFFAVDAEHARRAHDVTLGLTELARLHDATDARARWSLALRRAIAELPCDAVLLPPVLGSAGEGCVVHLERALGRPVGEVLAAGSIQSERLAAKLEQALGAIDPARISENVEVLVVSDEHVEARTNTETVRARAVVLACGRRFAGGISREGRSALLDVEAADGLAVDGHGRVLDREAQALSPRVLAAGTAVRGIDPARGVGFGVVAASGWLAGLEAARVARGSL